MKILLKNGCIVNVFTDTIEKTDVLIDNQTIVGVGDYKDIKADIVEDLNGKILCPGFIDGHIHIESTMLTPLEFSKNVLVHGTTSVIADPHEISNVCGINGIEYMLQASEGLPVHVYIMLPSCVPATRFDENYATLSDEDLQPFYKNERVIGLAEMMNYPGVLSGEESVLKKINTAHKMHCVVDGHAPLLSGQELDQYIAAGINSDHECSNYEEAVEKLKKGQWIMIRQGTAAHNLDALLELFNEPYSRRCLLVTDDREPEDLMKEGHIDHIIKLAHQAGKSILTGIRMATIQAAQCFGLRNLGAIAPGYRADILVLNDLESLDIQDVYSKGEKVVANKCVKDIKQPAISQTLYESIKNSMRLEQVLESDFMIQLNSSKARVIRMVKGELLTEEWIAELNINKDNGIDIDRDILKLAVVERHKNTKHIGLGYISGMGLKKGAIASTVSHDNHNLIVIGTNEEDMAFATNHIRKIGGGCVVVCEQTIIADFPLPIAGLISEESASVCSAQNNKIREAVLKLGTPKDGTPFMTMAFLSLPVIPYLKMSTFGLVDVCKQELVSLEG